MPIVPAIIGAFAIIALLNAALFAFSSNYELKRKIWPWPAVIGGVLFLALAIATGAPLLFIVVAIPSVAVLSWFQMRTVWFCPSCGSTVWPRAPFRTAEFCPKCGAKRPDDVEPF